ncbi:MAG: amidohydrolase family protein [Myxococcota bacterium]
MPPFPALDDEEGAHVPTGLRVWDAHVHFFPDRLFAAIWRWFDTYGWPIRHKLPADEVLAFLRARGVERCVGLCYAHKPGMAEALNHFMRDFSARHPEVIPLGTVMPGEPDARGIVRRALGELGLRGIKLHCHVQALAADDATLDPVYEEATLARRPVVIHAGREPAMDGLPRHPHELCQVDAIERVLTRHPGLTLVVPHLGADEFDAYEALLDRFPSLHLDTTMVVGEYFQVRPDMSMLTRRADRLMYGTDFPNIPYAWDRELHRILRAVPDHDVREKIFWRNTARVFGA